MKKFKSDIEITRNSKLKPISKLLKNKTLAKEEIAIKMVSGINLIKAYFFMMKSFR